MHEKDPEHWLYRLTSDEWLRAAANELAHSRRAFSAKSQREAVTHARRAGGMACNAILWLRADDSYGRSYMDHLAQLAKDPAIPTTIQQDAQALLSMPMKLDLVQLGTRGDPTKADPAARILEWAHQIAKSITSGN